MKTIEALGLVEKALEQRNLAGTLTAMENFLAAHPREADNGRLHAIRADFQLMADYWRRGFKDPQLPALYQQLLQKAHTLWADMNRGYTIGHSSYFSSIYMRVHLSARDWQPSVIREHLEAYVTETAMLALEPENKQAERLKRLGESHQQTVSILFDYLLLSSNWTDSAASAIEELLLAPTIDANDQQLMVSAITLSLLSHFDMGKFRTLVHLYQQATDLRVRQRALTGWALALTDETSTTIYPEKTTLVEQLLEAPACCQELVELQKQLIYCLNAEKDNQTIQEEIMPDLLKGSKIRVTQKGIEEIEDDPLEDILHPDEEERKLEQMEESFRRMADMQRQGSDIYFGGFSQMKRFPFFSDLSNWFAPYYKTHPAIFDIMNSKGDNALLRKFVLRGPFCDSDKYSLTLALEQVVSKLPQNVLDMLRRGEATLEEIDEEESRTPTFVRRTYLQDLYRFFRVYPQRSLYDSPFDGERRGYLFMAASLLSQTHLETSFGEVVAFLIKQRRMKDAGRLLENYGENRRDFQFYMMAGYLLQHGYYEFGSDDTQPEGDGQTEQRLTDEKRYGEAQRLTDERCYAEAYRLNPDSERALLGLAKSLFNQGRYEEALGHYNELLRRQPEKPSYVLNRCVCQIQLGLYGAGQNDLFRLHYERPDDDNVNRVLAWTLTCDGKYEKAEEIYRRLLTNDHGDGSSDLSRSDRDQENRPRDHTDDLLNYGYCLWLGGHVDEAADCFHRYLKETGLPPTHIVESEERLLREKGITEPEMQMMLYLL